MQKQLPFGTQCFMVSFLANLVLVLTLELLIKYVSSIIGFHFSNLLQFVIVICGIKKLPIHNL